ncbi:DsbA family protein [Streptomyces sp. NPDC050121]|jgi:putative protein-disulfide isomerase|uniref:DsbA family protein n=1 Tax=Streptomyces sp. NPDC050121 TaxID=3365601 RepID=UPI00378CD929
MATTGERVGLTYVFDAYCAWCHGFAPSLRAFAEARADHVDLRVLSAGLYTGARALPVSAHPGLVRESVRIAELTGAHFGAGHRRTVAEGSTVMDSTDAATGLEALLAQPGVDTLRTLEAMQHAWFVDGLSLSDPATYRVLADELGLSPLAVACSYAAPVTRARARAGLRAVRRLSVESYPALLIATAGGNHHRLGGPLTRVEELTTAFDKYMHRVSAPLEGTCTS